MEDIKTQLANRLKEANNVLVTVTKNPTIDQLSAAIGLTLILNRLGKHATTVFSGEVPPVIEFLHPEKTIEKNTDSLRDFIISLDKAKADKLRYKIEDQFVKIYITPYHTSINENDLVFSQGDFNVDVVVGLGLHQREELDQVITAHGRILHDATVSTINTAQPSTLGSINWSDKTSSSLCEMLVYLCDLLAKDGLLDAQISNALLTGIVSETQRFSNPKTTALTMSASSRLLAAGANQQLIAAQLTPPEPKEPAKKPEAHHDPTKPAKPVDDKPEDKGTIHIEHPEDKEKFIPLPEDESAEEEKDKLAQVQIDDQGELKTIQPDKPIAETESTDSTTDAKNVPEEAPKGSDVASDDGVPGVIKTETPPMVQPGGYLTEPPAEMDNLVDPLAPSQGGGGALGQGMPPLLSHDGAAAEQTNKPDLESVRNKINEAISSKPDQDFMAPITSLNAQPMGDNLHPDGYAASDIDSEDLPSLPPPPIPPPIIPPGGVPGAGNPATDAL